MPNNRHQSGFSFVIVLAVMAISILTIGTLVIVRVNQSSKVSTQSSNQANSEKPKSACTTKQGVKLCMVYPQSSLAYTEKITLTASLENTTDSDYDWSGSSSCNENAELQINGELTSRVCTQDFATFTLKPNEKRTSKLELTGAQMKIGNNQVSVSWAEIESPKITMAVKPLTDEDKAATKRCLNGDDQAICASLNVTLKSSYFSEESTCDELGKYFTSVKLIPQQKYCELANIGVVFFIVPKQEAEYYKKKLLELKQVDTVSIDQGTDSN